MAKGVVRRFETALGVIGVLALIVTAILITGWNPTPGVADWWKRVGENTGKLSDPETSWAERVGGQPSAAVVAGDAVVVTMRGTIEARGLRGGEMLWQRDADWAAVAGSGASAVAVVGRRGAGLEALDPTSGAVRWKDGDAVGAWTYADMVLTLSCGGMSDCTLAARAPGDGGQRWKVTLPGIGRVHAGANSDLLGTRELSTAFREATAAVPGPVPAMLGFPIEQRVQVVDMLAGKRLRQESPSNSSRVVVAGGRVLVSTAVPRDGNCRYTLEGRDAGTGQVVWKRDGYDLRTASGAGCEQRKDPAGADTALVATRGDNRELFLSPRDGRELWVAEAGETIVGTDGRFGLLRGADRKILKVISLSDGSKLWEQVAGEKAKAAITHRVVLVSDPSTGRLKALDPVSGRTLLDAKTSVEVLGYDDRGLVLGRGRTIGFLPFEGGSPS